MGDALDITTREILEPSGLDRRELSKVLDSVLGHAVDDADLYFQATRSEAWVLEDGIVKEGSHNIEQGVGVRAVSGEKSGFAYADEVALPALERAAGAARAIARAGAEGRMQAGTSLSVRERYPPLDPLQSFGERERIELLQAVDTEARAQDPRVKQVIVSLAGEHDRVLVAAADGRLAADVRPLVRLNVSVVAEQGARREQASSGGGGRHDYRYFLEEGRALGYAREAVRQALVSLEAADAPAGTMTVVLGPGWPGVLLHEAVGHGLEGDFNRKGSSAFSGTHRREGRDLRLHRGRRRHPPQPPGIALHR